ncbi:MAG: CHRD domain-containing protein, partial [Acidobacteriota bacterium]|nr:CHRD domain-containing protein [Acidobacteriota bacterium]
MKKTFALALGLTSFTAILMAQTAETAYFQGLMSPLNEVPAISLTDFPGAALGTVIAHVVRDSSGKIISGTADFQVDYRVLAGGVNFTGLHIHKGAAGATGDIVIPTEVSAANPVKDDASIGRVNKSVQVLASNAAGLE